MNDEVRAAIDEANERRKARDAQFADPIMPATVRYRPPRTRNRYRKRRAIR